MIQLIKSIKANNVINIGNFKLASGKQSNIMFDCKNLTLDSEGIKLASHELFQKLIEYQFDCIGGLELGAIPIVTGLLAYCPYQLKGFIVRKQTKEHGTKKLIEGPVKPGMRCVIVEDVTTTGGSALKAWQVAQEFGMIPVVVASIINREEGATELFANLKIPFFSLLTKAQLVGA